jgi:hypothetical protein
MPLERNAATPVAEGGGRERARAASEGVLSLRGGSEEEYLRSEPEEYR